MKWLKKLRLKLKDKACQKHPHPILTNPDQQELIWTFFIWIIQSHASISPSSKSLLILPNSTFFPDKIPSQDQLSPIILNRVISLTQIQLPDPVFEQLHQESLQIDPAKLPSAEFLIAKFARELAFYKLSTHLHPPTQFLDSPELFVDLMALSMGFGIILINSAYSKQCSSCCSTMQKTGFLDLNEYAYALALYAHIENLPPLQIAPLLHFGADDFFLNAYYDILTNERLSMVLLS